MAISNNSTGLRPGVCTSTTRPTAPYTGQKIFETDTKNELTWDGSAWSKPWNQPWGYIDGVGGTATTAIAATTPLAVLSKSITITAGRKYRINGSLGFQPSANSGGNALYFTSTSGSNKTLWYQGETILANYPMFIEGSYITDASALGVTSGTAAKTFTLYIRCAGNGNLNTNPDAVVGANSAEQLFWIEDMGPA